MIKVSIIIPVYNVEKYLRQCLDSCINQTLKDIEIICVDDCSPDNCPAILDEYARKDSRVKVIHLQENVGQGSAKNIALDNAVGEYLVFLDSDDWLEENALEILYNKISETNDDFLFFGRYLYYEKNKNKKEDNHYLIQFKGIDPININLSKINKLYIRNGEATAKIFKKSYVDKCNLKFYGEVRQGEDWAFSIPAILCSNSVSVVDIPLYTYRIHPASTFHNPNLWLDYFKALNYTYTLLKGKNIKYNCLLLFVIKYIKTINYHYNQWKKRNYKIAQEYYGEMRKLYHKLDEEWAVSKMEGNPFYSEMDSNVSITPRVYKNILKYSYEQSVFIDCLQKMFSVTNTNKHKIITICGLKIKIKKVVKC